MIRFFYLRFSKREMHSFLLVCRHRHHRRRRGNRECTGCRANTKCFSREHTKQSERKKNVGCIFRKTPRRWGEARHVVVMCFIVVCAASASRHLDFARGSAIAFRLSRHEFTDNTILFYSFGISCVCVRVRTHWKPLKRATKTPKSQLMHAARSPWSMAAYWHDETQRETGKGGGQRENNLNMHSILHTTECHRGSRQHRISFIPNYIWCVRALCDCSTMHPFNSIHHYLFACVCVCASECVSINIPNLTRFDSAWEKNALATSAIIHIQIFIISSTSTRRILSRARDRFNIMMTVII